MKPGYLFKIINVFAAITLFCLAAQAANIEWSVPAPADDDTNVITAGSLDRAYVLGYGSEQVTVNGVNFVRFGKNRAQNQNQESVTDEQTQLIVGGDGDGIIADKTQIKESFASSASYHSLLDAGVHDNGSPLALILEDLAVGKRYYLQIWPYDPSNPKTALTLSGGTNSVRIDSLTACQVVGTFVADTIRQAVVITPFRGSAQLNAFQLRRADDFAGEPALIQQPRSTTVSVEGTTKLVALATGNPEPTFQWQKLDGHDADDLTGNGMLSGSKTSTLTVHSAPLEAAGDYRLVAANLYGSVTSSVVSITVATNPLINVAVSGAELVSYQGRAVLPGTPYDLWNSVDSRSSFTNVALMDSTGTATPVTLSLQKSGSGSAIPEPLLGGISYATKQIVTISNLLANEFYDLAVFSIGSQANEGGVFSGAVNGMAKGYPNVNVTPANFLAGVNYVENPFARTDKRGTLSFTINANKTGQSNGYYNCDFNGLQLRKSSWPQGKPVVLQQPLATAGYVGQSATLSVLSAVSTDDPLTYQWQKVTPSGFSNLIDAGNVTGVNSHQVTFHHLSASDSGTYQVAISSSNGSVTSRIAAVRVFTNQLINVAVNPGGGPCKYSGLAVLPGLPTDRWNGVDARRSFNNHSLVDSTGKPTAVTMSLFKTAGDAIPNALLGGISYAAKHIVTLNELEPDNFYHLVVFSIGDQANEGGVFTGAVNGISHGYSIRNGAKADFIENTNYVENLFARTDDKGQLRFTIRPNATIMPYGYDNCDFNGLQLQQTSLAHHAPVFSEPPTSVRTYLHHTTTLRATVAGPTDSVMACQWRKITPEVPLIAMTAKCYPGPNQACCRFLT